MLEEIQDWLQAHDLGTLYWFGARHSPWLDWFMVNATHLGDRPLVMVVTGVAALLFAVMRRWVPAVVLVAAVLAGGFLSDNGKRFAGRERPDVSWRLVHLPGNDSFPSGHATYAMALYGTLALLCARRARGLVRRGLILIAGFGLALLIGVSRVYVGVHYPLDVIGGWVAGLACALLAAWADVRWGTRDSAPARGPQPATQAPSASEGTG
jgi:undecaprenyl-diphosphatase